MGFTELLTIVFIILKLIGVISWSWWLVCLPEIIAGVFYLLVIFGALFGAHKTNKAINKHFDDFNF